MTTIAELPLDTPTKIDETDDVEVWATRTVNGATIERRLKVGGRSYNRETIRADLQGFFADADAAQTQITNLLASAAPGNGTLTTAQLSNAVRQLDTALRQVATIERGVIKRAVALVRLAIDALDSTSGTT